MLELLMTREVGSKYNVTGGERSLKYSFTCLTIFFQYTNLFLEAAKKASPTEYNDKDAYVSVQKWLQQLGTLIHRAQKRRATAEAVV